MKARDQVCCVLLIILSTGCGSLSTLSGRNGEHYLATQRDCQALVSVIPDSHAQFQLGIIPAIPWVLCWAADLPISLVADTLLLPYDYHLGVERGFYVRVVDDEGTPVPDAIIGGFSGRRVSGVADKMGRFRWSSDSRSIEGFQVSKTGYYTTEQNPRGQGHIAAELSASRTNTLTVILKRIRNPLPMYAKEATVALPAMHGIFGYDLMVGDLVAPHGKGVAADFVFHVQKGAKPLCPDLDITFSSPHDGIQRHDSTRALRDGRPRQSTYIFPYEAPADGYSASLSAADALADAGRSKDERWRNHYYDANYLFRVRSSDSTNGLYGRIYGFFRVYDVILRGTRIPKVSFIYFLNPSGTRNLEWNGVSLITEMSRYGTHEYTPSGVK